MSIYLADSTTLPMWAVLPLGVVTMLIIARHVMLLQDAPMPASRRRIRTANGLLMMGVTALLVYGLGVMRTGPTAAASINEVRAFVTVWSVIAGLMPIVIGLAMLDAMNNVRLHVAERRGLREQFGTKLSQDLASITIRRRHAGPLAAGGTYHDDSSGDGPSTV